MKTVEPRSPLLSGQSDGWHARSPAIVLGTRPEVIKLAPLLRRLGPAARVLHTGQHFDSDMFDLVVRECGLAVRVEQVSNVGGLQRSLQVSRALEGLTSKFEEDPPSVVVVQGDTNAALAGALAGNMLNLPVVHVEAGLRSGDLEMPEEVNRRLIAGLATVHCAPTPGNVRNLLREGVEQEAIALTGNTIVESTRRLMKERDAAGRHSRGTWVTATIHRPENTDSVQALSRVLTQLNAIRGKVLMVLHPRTAAAIDHHRLWRLGARLTFLPPQGPAGFLRIAEMSRLLISDSGGIQEECTVLQKRTLVVRKNTERPEAMESGFARLVTPDMDICREAEAWLKDQPPSSNSGSPFGDGFASGRIAQIICDLQDGRSPAEASRAALRTYPVAGGHEA